MRLFIGTFTKGIITREVYSGIKKDFAGSAFGKWVEPENIHFTYKFLGDTDKKTCDSLLHELKNVLAEYSDEIVVRGIGTFPGPHRPRVLYAGIDFNKRLLDINSEIEKITAGLGFEPEDKKFHPHITLMRIKDCERQGFVRALEKYKDTDFGMIDGFRVSLIESQLSSAGPVYKEIG